MITLLIFFLSPTSGLALYYHTFFSVTWYHQILELFAPLRPALSRLSSSIISSTLIYNVRLVFSTISSQLLSRSASFFTLTTLLLFLPVFFGSILSFWPLLSIFIHSFISFVFIITLSLLPQIFSNFTNKPWFYFIDPSNTFSAWIWFSWSYPPLPVLFLI